MAVPLPPLEGEQKKRCRRKIVRAEGAVPVPAGAALPLDGWWRAAVAPVSLRSSLTMLDTVTRHSSDFSSHCLESFSVRIVLI